MTYSKLRLILGDQLNGLHSWFAQPDDQVIYLIAELKQETNYVTHHIQKVCAFFAAMASFASEKRRDGHQVIYLTLDDTVAFESLGHLIVEYVHQLGVRQFEYQRPDEYRLSQELLALRFAEVSINCVDTEHFFLPYADIFTQFSPNKHQTMEHFYRRMRKRFDFLMENGKPVGGKWNYDANNRQKLKPDDLKRIPEPLLFSTNVDDIVERLNRHKVKTIGNMTRHGDQQCLIWPTNRTQALALLHYFCQYCLVDFGRFQDAMTAYHQAKWSLYHSRLSFALNAKLLSPKEVIDSAVNAYQQTQIETKRQAQSKIEISQIEGFVRQILGWREYIRGVYWVNMPRYAKLNALNASRKLPNFFWTGKTKMRCLNQSIGQSLDFAYAHHIQRLMMTANFCLLTEIEPSQVEDWYLGIYIDAIEWVEMPNTRGMGLFADGGIVGTKPYAASGAYVNKMSDYCVHCHYEVKTKVGDKACPLNSLYWYFMDKHSARLATHPRTRMIFRSWDNMAPEARQKILEQARYYLEHIEDL